MTLETFWDYVSFGDFWSSQLAPIFGLVHDYLFLQLFIRLDALALSVIATATWLGGWVARWLPHSGIVSKRLNLSENFFDYLKAPSH